MPPNTVEPILPNQGVAAFAPDAASVALSAVEGTGSYTADLTTAADFDDFGSAGDVGSCYVRGLGAYGIPDGYYTYVVTSSTALGLVSNHAIGGTFGETSVSGPTAVPITDTTSLDITAATVTGTTTAVLTVSGSDPQPYEYRCQVVVSGLSASAATIADSTYTATYTGPNQYTITGTSFTNGTHTGLSGSIEGPDRLSPAPVGQIQANG